ncbi:MMPL family transporter [Actinoplanes lobatus]|uniref:RND superfamily putative drug exporter n=1 Tax=Actinoplanes lobatus TaxID=113568 RepID=A0A7W7MLS2_9ACTN|nr:MMPL family transporter [Actinoplanes lobatus]MBB4754380.1 RND superfamily putative drug exporter [Actinoplanes lobatus]
MLIIALVAVLGAGVWGFGVFGQLTEGGYNDPSSESARATEVVTATTKGQSGDVIAIYTPDQGTIDDPVLGTRIKDRLAALPKSAVTAQTSYWDQKAPAFAAEDKSSGVAVVSLVGADDAAKMDAYAEIEDSFAVPGAHVQVGGGIPLAHASSERSTEDLAFAEMVSLPIVLILLLVIFGSLVAASLPVLVGGCAVLGSLGVLHLVALNHEVNSFAVNMASLLGLGMAIDYGLFMVGRFREEQAVHPTAEAVRRTVATAGRTVVFSATLLMTALAGLLLFPQGFLKSLAYGGLAAVFLAMLLSLTLLPALLAVLGPRVDYLPVRLPFAARTGTGGWQRLAEWVLRRPVLVAVPILISLLVLAWPITDARFGENDERQLPAGDPSRVAVETLKADYPQFSADGVQIVVQSANGAKPDVEAYTDAAGKVAGVTEVTATGGNGEDVVVLTADLDSTDSFSTESRQAVEDLRALPAPAGTDTLVGGVTARNVDSLAAIADKLPVMIALLVGATLVLMFLAFGSILLPIKAVVMSALSLTATFGVLVWIFQKGHGASLLDVTPTSLEAGIVVLMAAVVFGLSTDYEVFLLSRMVEARLRGATTDEAVTLGLTRTGRVISAAALLLIVVTGAFSLSSISTMRFIGVGMIIALVLDATVVRVLLVPSVLALLGDASWWAPGPLRRLQERAGLAEYAGEEEPTGRHAYRPPAIDGTVVSRALPAAPAQAALPAGSSPEGMVLDYDAFLEYISEKENGTAPFGFPLPGSTTVAPSTITGTPGESSPDADGAVAALPSDGAVVDDATLSALSADSAIDDGLSSGDAVHSLDAAAVDDTVSPDGAVVDDVFLSAGPAGDDAPSASDASMSGDAPLSAEASLSGDAFLSVDASLSGDASVDAAFSLDGTAVDDALSAEDALLSADLSVDDAFSSADSSIDDAFSSAGPSVDAFLPDDSSIDDAFSSAGPSADDAFSPAGPSTDDAFSLDGPSTDDAFSLDGPVVDDAPWPLSLDGAAVGGGPAEAAEVPIADGGASASAEDDLHGIDDLPVLSGGGESPELTEEPITFAAVEDALTPTDPLSADLSRIASGELEPAELAPSLDDDAAPEPVDSDAIWAEVEATLAAGAEAANAEVPVLEPTFDEFGVSATQVIHLPTQPDEADEADTSAIQIIQLPPTAERAVTPADPAHDQHTSIPAAPAIDLPPTTSTGPTHDQHDDTSATPVIQLRASMEESTAKTVSAESDIQDETPVFGREETEPTTETFAQTPDVAALPSETTPVTATEAPALDPFSWRSDPRLANLAVSGSASFPWLVRPTEPSSAPAGPTTPGDIAVQAEVPAESAAFGSAENAGAAEFDAASGISGMGGNGSASRPDATLPHPLADRTGQRRPQTLDDWLAASRPQSLGDLPTTGAHRPETLDEWLTTTSSETPDTEDTTPPPADDPDAASTNPSSEEPSGDVEEHGRIAEEPGGDAEDGLSPEPVQAADLTAPDTDRDNIDYSRTEDVTTLRPQDLPDAVGAAVVRPEATDESREPEEGTVPTNTEPVAAKTEWETSEDRLAEPETAIVAGQQTSVPATESPEADHEPLTVPEPIAEPEPTTEPATEPQSKTEQVTEPEPATEPATEPEPATEQVTEPEPMTEQVIEPEPMTEPIEEPRSATEQAEEIHKAEAARDSNGSDVAADVVSDEAIPAQAESAVAEEAEPTVASEQLTATAPDAAEQIDEPAAAETNSTEETPAEEPSVTIGEPTTESGQADSPDTLIAEDADGDSTLIDEPTAESNPDTTVAEDTESDNDRILIDESIALFEDIADVEPARPSATTAESAVDGGAAVEDAVADEAAATFADQHAVLDDSPTSAAGDAEVTDEPAAEPVTGEPVMADGSAAIIEEPAGEAPAAVTEAAVTETVSGALTASPVIPRQGRRPRTLGDLPVGAWSEDGQPVGRRPETLDDRLRGAGRPATLADHLSDHGGAGRRPANAGPAWVAASGEHPYDRQTRRPASLADHPGPARSSREAVTEEPEPGSASSPS